jgi:hypothetical protein
MPTYQACTNLNTLWGSSHVSGSLLQLQWPFSGTRRVILLLAFCFLSKPIANCKTPTKSLQPIISITPHLNKKRLKKDCGTKNNGPGAAPLVTWVRR